VIVAVFHVYGKLAIQAKRYTWTLYLVRGFNTIVYERVYPLLS
jgi:hypothetical protein